MSQGDQLSPKVGGHIINDEFTILHIVEFFFLFQYVTYIFNSEKILTSVVPESFSRNNGLVLMTSYNLSVTVSVCVIVQQALTHPSFRMNYGTNADHARNSLTNCGKRQLEYGDKRIHFIHTRKRGELNVSVIHRVPKSATTLASNTPNSIRS